MTNKSNAHPVNFAQLTVTLDLAYKAGGTGETPEVQAWVLEQLNSKPEFVQVKASNPTGFLGWPEFLDAPMSTDHPDYPADVALLKKVEHWLTLDRKALIQALINADGEHDQPAVDQPATDSAERKDCQVMAAALKDILNASDNKQAYTTEELQSAFVEAYDAVSRHDVDNPDNQKGN